MEDSLKRAEKAEAEQNQIFAEIQTVTDKAEKLSEQKKKDKPLTREIVQAVIDTVVIHDEQTVEIRFTFDDIARRAVEYTQEHGIKLKDCTV